MSQLITCKPSLYTSSQRAMSATLGLACSVSVLAPAALAHSAGPAPFTPAFANASSHTGYVVKSPVSAVIHAHPVTTTAATTTSTTAGNLNLASASQTFLAGNLANFSTLSIDVGGRQQQVSLNTKLTAAEAVAVEQVLTTGSQGLQLSSHGVATGGTINLNGNLLSALDNSLGGGIGSLTVAHGVQLVDSVSTLDLSGRLANYGSILTAGNVSGATDQISAGSIVNAVGGVIASYTTTSGSAGNAGSPSGLYAASASLNAATSLTNNGNISSVGNLTISAPVVSNVAVHGSAPTISAAQNVNINTQSLTNSGLVSAAAGNINVASNGALALTGTGGTLQANQGNINVSSSNADINVNGGNMLSQQVNFNAGTGNIAAELDQVTGVVNAAGNQVQVNGNTRDLIVGSVVASGDPLVSNSGDVTISAMGPVATKGQPLSVVAGQDIITEGGVLDTSSATGAGGALTLIAGAAFTPGTTIKVTGASATGGIIDLTGGNGGTAPITSITSGSSYKTSAAGAIEMVAFAGTDPGSGAVIVPTSVTINAGSTAGAAGAVTIIAGATSGTAVSTGAIIGKTVTVDTATPKTSGVSFSATGVASGTFTAGTPANAANVSIGNVTGTLDATSAGNVSVANSTSPLTLGTISLGTTGSLVATNSAGTTLGGINVTGVITGNTIDISGTGLVSDTKTITASGTDPIVTIDGGASTVGANAVVIGAAVSASDQINIGLAPGAKGSIALNAAVGTATTTAVTGTVDIDANSGISGGSISGVGIVSAQTINLGATGSIGSASKPIQTKATTLSAGKLVAGTLNITNSGASSGGAFVAQKSNLILGNDSSSNLVVKVTGTLDVAGTVTAPNLNLTSSGTTTIDATGVVTNGGAQGAMVINSVAFNLDAGGRITTTSDNQAVTINATGLATISGAIAVQTLDLKTTLGVTIASGAQLTDSADNITSKGVVLVDGQINDTSLSVTTTKAFTFDSTNDLVVNGSGSINALTIDVAAGSSILGNVNYTTTGAGDSFINNGTINGQAVTVNTTSSTGVIDNIGTLEAVAQSSASTVPVLNLNTHIINNTGTIAAYGQEKETNGILNITSPGTLVITGNSDSFQAGFYSAVNLKAAGNITVGNASSNPFSGLNATNELGSFSIATSATGIFTSPLTGISVSSNPAGTVGGTISISAGSVAISGSGSTSPFSLSVAGAAGGSVGKSPITLNISGAKGLTVGTAAGDFELSTTNFDNTSLITLTTPGALTVNTAQLPGAPISLALTGTKSLLIDGYLNEGTAVGTDVTLKTNSTASFLVGGATTNGIKDISAGQGATAYNLTIDSPGLVVLQAGTSTTAGSVLSGADGVTINGKGLTVNAFSDVVSSDIGSSGLTITAATGNVTYTNLNTDVANPGLIDVSTISLNAAAGSVVLASATKDTVLSVLPLDTGVATFGGVFNINARTLTFGTEGVLFNASSSANGGQVNLNLTSTGLSKIGVGAGNISANVSSGAGWDGLGADSGTVSLITDGSIAVTNLVASTPAINFGSSGRGQLILDAAGLVGKISLKEVTGIDISTLSLTNRNPIPFVLNDATAGNGILDGATGELPTSITVGSLTVNNGGQVVTNGITINGLQQLAITSPVSINASQLPGGFIASAYPVAGGGTAGGTISLVSPLITVSQTGLLLQANGGTTAGGSISVNTISTTTASPLTIGTGAGAIRLDVGTTVDNMGGSISVVSSGPINADASAINFGTNASVVGASLSLTSGAGGNLLLNNVASLNGLQLGSVSLTSGGASPFVLAGATASGNGIGTGTLTAGTITIKTVGGQPINAAGELLVTNNLTLNTGGAVNFNNGQTLSVVANGAVGNGNAATAGNGGTITIDASSIGGTGVTLSAVGAGTVNTTGGTITVNASSASGFTVGSTGVLFDVSDNGGKAAGSVSVISGGQIAADLTGITYGTAGNGSLSLNGSSLLISNASKFTTDLGSLTLVSNSGNVFQFGNALVNGFVGNATPTITATQVSITNSGPGGIDTTGGVVFASHDMTLSTPGTIAIGAGLSVAADSSGNGGSISITAGSFEPTAPFAFNAAGTTGAGGSVTVKLTSVSGGTLVIGSGSDELSVNVSNASGKAGGTISITTTGAIQADASSLDLGSNYASGQGANLTLAAGVGSSNPGTVTISNASSFATLGLQHLNLISNSTAAFVLGGTLGTPNGITDTGTYTITAANINIANSGGAILAGTGNITLSGTTSISLTAAGDIGSTIIGAVKIGATPSLSVNAGGGVTIATAGDTAVTYAYAAGALDVNATGGNLTIGGATPGSITAGSININYANSNAANTNTLIIRNGGTSNGDFIVASNAQNLQVAAGATLTSNDGNIVLEEATSNATANISILANATIHASGPAADSNEGNVSIYLGTAPSVAPGQTPLGAPTVIETGGALVTFGATDNVNGTISVADSSVVLAALGRQVEFNTGSFGANAISLSTGVQITADPPVGGAMVSAGTPSAIVSTVSAVVNNSTVNATTSNALTSNLSGAPLPLATTISSTAFIPSATSIYSSAANLQPMLSNGFAGVAVGAINNPSVTTMTVAGGGNVSSLNTAQNSSRVLSGGVSNEVRVRKVLNQGPLLLSPEQNEVVETPYGTVSVAANSVALIVSSDKGLAVYDLHDGRKNAVVVHSDAGTVSLAPGRSVVLTTASAKGFEDVNPAPFVAYRHVSGEEAGATNRMYHSEFDLMSMVRGLPALKALISSDSAKTRKTMNNMLKTAAILMQISQSNEPYRQYLAPKLTAFLGAAQR